MRQVDYLIIFSMMSVILSSSYLLGSFLLIKLSHIKNNFLYIPMGFGAIIALITILSFPFVYFKLSSEIYFYCVLFLFIIPFIFLRKFKIDLKRIDFTNIMLMFVLLSLLIYVSYHLGLAEENFDTLHYLATIIETSNSDFLVQFIESGYEKTTLIATEDFQAYYYFLSAVYFFSQKIKLSLEFSILTLNMPIVIWVGSILRFILSISILFATFEELKIKSILKKVPFIILIILYFGTFYYNTVFAFYGNSFRTLYAAVLSLLVYKNLKDEEINIKSAFLILLTSFAMNGFSSSGYFITLFILYGYTISIFNKHFIHFNLGHLYIYLMPTIVFILNVISLSYSLTMGLLLIGLLILVYVLYKLNADKMNVFIKLSFRFLIPLFIFVYSAYLLLTKQILISFFMDGGFGDMAWGYFSFYDNYHVLTNLLLWISLIYYLLKSNDSFKIVILSIFIVFLNPVCYAFLVKYLTLLIFYRGFDSIFNIFTMTLLIHFLLESMKYKKTFYLIFLSISIYLAQHSLTEYYHQYFVPEENYDGFSRLVDDEAHLFEVLNTKIVLENYDRAKVIGSTPTVKGFVSNIYSLIDVNYYRNLKRFSDTNQSAPSELVNIFTKRFYFGEPLFDTPANYDQVCTYLVDEKVDFVILDKSQFYEKDGVYVPLYFEVRGCASFIYENDSFMLYQLYWK